MTQKQVDISVSGPASLKYWVAVDDQDVPMNNGKGTVQLDEGEHLLFWWLAGNPGDALDITVEEGNSELYSKTTKVPKNSESGGGYGRFTV